MARKKAKKNKTGFWFVVAIVFLMLTSTIGYLFKGGSSEKYNHFSFSATGDGRWITKIDGNNKLFYYHPSETEKINLSDEAIKKIKNTNMVYITYDINNSQRENIAAINLELSKILWEDFNIYSLEGLTSANQYNMEVISCFNATGATPVIYYNESNMLSINIEQDCIVLNGKTTMEFIALKERMVYGLYGVIE
jgi:hypothetical protein